MNSIVWPIFNESFGEKEVYGSRKQCPRPTGKDKNMFLKKKKNPKCRRWNADSVSKQILSLFFAKLFYYSVYFYYYSWAPLYFQQKVFSFSKISKSQTDPNSTNLNHTISGFIDSFNKNNQYFVFCHTNWW